MTRLYQPHGLLEAQWKEAVMACSLRWNELDMIHPRRYPI